MRNNQRRIEPHKQIVRGEKKKINKIFTRDEIGISRHIINFFRRIEFFEQVKFD